MKKKPIKLFENEHFVIEHSVFYRIAGLLFVAPKREVHSISDMTDAELALLGKSLSIANNAIQAVLQPINIYSAKFGESDHSVHFHVFPRTPALTEAYRKETGATASIEAPKLISWAHNRFLGRNEFGDIGATIEALHEHFSKMG